MVVDLLLEVIVLPVVDGTEIVVDARGVVDPVVDGTLVTVDASGVVDPADDETVLPTDAAGLVDSADDCTVVPVETAVVVAKELCRLVVHGVEPVGIVLDDVGTVVPKIFHSSHTVHHGWHKNSL